MKIQQIELKKLVPYSFNNKKHPEKQIELLINSIQDFWFTQPIVVDENFVIIIWHARTEAAKRLWLTKVPVIVRDDLDPVAIKKLRILDNKLSDLAEWDKENLKLELEEIWDEDLISLFDDLDLSFLDEDEENKWKTDDDDIPELPQKIIVKEGDIFQLWKHKVICGSSTDPETIKILLWDKKADMVFTDPPYLMDFSGSVHSNGEKSANGNYDKIENDKMSEEDGKIFLKKIVENIKEFTDGAFYICFYRLWIDKILNACNENSLQWRNLIIWHKNNHNLSNSDYMSLYEPIIYGWNWKHNFYGEPGETDVIKITKKTDTPDIIVSKKSAYIKSLDKYYKIQRINKPDNTKNIIDVTNGAKLVAYHDETGDVWEIDKTQVNDLHPTMKPVALVERAIWNSSKPWQIILDLFLWSGTTLIWAEKKNRICYGVELKPWYVQVIIKRYAEFTWTHAEIKCLNRKLDINEILES